MPRTSPDRIERDRLERCLHDMTNSLAAARSFGEVVLRRTRTAGSAEDLGPLVESLLKELDRVADMAKSVRRDTHAQGDVLQCARCSYTFVNLRSSGDAPPCRRCGSDDVGKWKPSK